MHGGHELMYVATIYSFCNTDFCHNVLKSTFDHIICYTYKICGDLGCLSVLFVYVYVYKRHNLDLQTVHSIIYAIKRFIHQS